MSAIEPLIAPLTNPQRAKDQGWRRVGELEDGRPIWEADFEVKVGQEPVVINGETQWVMAGAERVKPKMRAVMETRARRFVEVQAPTGNNFRNFDFEPDPEEKARIERKQKVSTFMERLAEEAVDRGIDSPEVLFDAIASEKPRQSRSRAKKAD